MQLSSFVSLTSLLMAGALSLQLSGCGQAPGGNDETTTSAALTRSAAAADMEAVAADTPVKTTVARTNVVDASAAGANVATATTTASKLVDTGALGVKLDAVLAVDWNQLPADVSAWNSPAALTYYACRDGSGQRLCGNNKPAYTSRTVSFGTVEPRKVVPNAKVQFGPFHLKKNALVIPSGTGPSATFTVSVWARSPAVYGAGGNFLGAQINLVKIAEETRTITDNNHEEDLYVTAKLPSVFTAIQLRATVDDNSLTPGTASYPAACGNLPATASDPAALDAPCLQAAINPMAVVSPHWLPLSIVYEPPGNCSWANLTQEHTAGAAITVQQNTSNSSNTVSDSGFFWDDQHGDYTSEKVTASSRRTQVTVKRTGSVGTRLGLPLNNPGNPNCNVPGANVPPRLDGGPGRGDLFVLLKDPSLLYWDTANMTNTAFSPWSPPDISESMVMVTAQQIATGTGLPPGVSFTAEERDALLALDPFVASPTGAPPASRFIALDVGVELGQGLSYEQTQSHAVTVDGGQTLTERTQSKSSSSNSDPVVSLTMKGLAYGGGYAAGVGAGKALTALNGGFADMADKIGSLSLPELYKDESTTTVVTSYGKSTLLEKTDGHAVTQQFYIQDTGQGMTIGLYYDSLFGTYAFGPPPASPTAPGVVMLRPAGLVSP
jgi:hypothetical protein